MGVVIREYTPADQLGVEAIDTSFSTPTIFDLVVEPRRIELRERTLEQPHLKRYPIEDAFAFWATWKTAWVAVDGDRIVGFAAVEYEAWHTRLVLWHLYVDPSRRKSGIARQLLAAVETHARRKSATHVWLETSNVNVPGIAAYERLGYTLCGVDELYYQSLGYAHEQAIYLAKRL
jgi:ribosomal protein S18 acetylase RimI-like enzyme